MEKIINYLKALKPIIILFIVEYFVIFIASIIYSLFFMHLDLEKFLFDYINPVMIIVNIILIIYFSKSIKNKNTLKYRYYFPLIYLGISVSLFINSLIIKITLGNTPSNINIILLIIGTGIVGPILEEVIFRGIFLNKLKESFSNKTAIILNVITFALVHGNLVSIIYGLLMGIILVFVYEKYKNIKAPILTHIAANLIVLLLDGFYANILYLSLIGIFISIYLVFVKKF